MKDKLDLDSTIEHLEDKEKTLRLFDFDNGCKEAADEYNQIVEWLKELKELRKELIHPSVIESIHPSVITIQKTTTGETFPRCEYGLDGNIYNLTITNGNEFKSSDQ